MLWLTFLKYFSLTDEQTDRQIDRQAPRLALPLLHIHTSSGSQTLSCTEVLGTRLLFCCVCVHSVQCPKIIHSTFGNIHSRK